MKRICLLLACLILLTFSSLALATPYTEVGDAGETLATSQVLASGTTVVYGSYNNDADLFLFGWGGGDFYVNSVGTSTDSQLFLFNAAGQGVQANDDGIAFAGPAYLQLTNLAAGNYYLGISIFDYDPRTADGSLMFTSSPYGPLYGPLDPTAVLDHWSGTSYDESGAYTINFSTTSDSGDLGDDNPTTDPTNNPVPEPSTILLFGGGLAGLAFYRRKRK